MKFSQNCKSIYYLFFIIIKKIKLIKDEFGSSGKMLKMRKLSTSSNLILHQVHSISSPLHCFSFDFDHPHKPQLLLCHSHYSLSSLPALPKTLLGSFPPKRKNKRKNFNPIPNPKSHLSPKMGNCAATRLAGAGLGLSCSDSDDPVSLCRERKRLIKSAVAQRRALSCAHAEYIDSLHSVATALDLFILRHSAPAPILITLPPSSPTKIEALTFHSEEAQKVNEAVKEEKEEKVQEVEVKQEPEMGCGYYFEEEGEMTMPSPPPTGTNGLEGWDFFNPFYGFQTGVQTGLPTDPGFCKASNEEEEEALRMVREKEGIPELEEAEPEAEMEKKVVGFEEEEKAIATGEDCNGGTMEEKALEVSELSVNRKELLEALKDVCDLFFRAYNSGKDISRMLEVSRKEPLSAIEEAKGVFFLSFRNFFLQFD